MHHSQDTFSPPAPRRRVGATAPTSAKRGIDDFGVSISLRSGVAHLRVTGSVGESATPTLEHLLERLPAADIKEIVVDLTETSAVSDPVLDVVLASSSMVEQAGGSVEVRRA